MDLANASDEIKGEVLFRVRWIIRDRNGDSGEIFIVNSFSENPDDENNEAASSATS